MIESTAPQSNSIRFGTDGWRAIIGDKFTFANLEIVTQAYADYINAPDIDHLKNNHSPPYSTLSHKQKLIIVGYDGRFLSEQFAERVAQVLRGNNLKIALFDEAVPTPLVSWAVREQSAAGGIVITASHNPAEFNGFKIKDNWGRSASDDITRAVESLIKFNSPRVFDTSVCNSSAIIKSATESYRDQISAYIDLENLRSSKHQVIVDSMHGVGGVWIESFLKNGNLGVETIRANCDPLFGGINPEPVNSNLAALKTRVKEAGAVIGLATDGDADRLGAVNERGQTMSMHEVVPLLLLHLIRHRGMTGGVVRTFSQSVLTKRIADTHGLQLFETPIGFKYIADLMLRENILLGAEESGGIGLQNHIPERDGILNSLLLLEAVITAGKAPSEIICDIQREFGEFYFDRRDLKIQVNQGQDFVTSLALNAPSIIAGEKVKDIETLDGTKLLFADESWLLFRQSGTEPVLRVYCEATSITKRDVLLETGSLMAHNLIL
jgi:phosphomannomutase